MRRLSMKVARATFDDKYLYVSLLGGGMLAVPLEWVPPLDELPLERRQRWELRDADEVLYWPELDIRLSVPYLLGRAS